MTARPGRYAAPVQNRTALVTGAGRGIGRAVAVALAGAGHAVALTARSEAALVETAALCGPAHTVVIPADITAPGAVEHIFAAAEAALGPVEVLVANAGAASSGPLAAITDEEWQRQLDLNLTAPFRCVRRAVPGMVARGWGRIVVLGSTASKQGAPYIAAYAAAKHGVLGVVRSAAAELAKTGVTVNAVCPGFVDTPMTDGSVALIVAKTGRSADEARAVLAAAQPMNRLITPDEVAAAVMFCIASPGVTGQGINVDGGAVQS
jgi:NAD(P)-dependent dehydrogenase (short-subunit alcohol dehydrogenase family)